MSRRLVAGLGVLLLFAALTVLMTWPQAAHLTTHVANNDDPLLSIWRVSWIAHALAERPADLFNGNIFYPEQRTLAYSDSTLLQGLLAAPFIWAGISNITVYNVLLLSSFALSGAAMFLYAFELTASRWAAAIAGIVFAFAPYRYDHFHHLELQAALFIPLALWSIERALAGHGARYVYGAIAAVTLQVFCAIYYAIFLVTALLFIVPLRLAALAAKQRRTLTAALAIGVVGAAVVVGPYLYVYSLNRTVLGDRSIADIRLYSATPANYLATSLDNRVHGVSTEELGENERRLAVGVFASILAVVGLRRLDRCRLTLLTLGIVGFVISLGFNSPIYEWLLTVAPPYRGLRVPARAAILVAAAVAALAAFGWSAIEARLKHRSAVGLLVSLLLLAEYSTRLESWLILPEKPSAVYQWLAARPRSVVVEFPVSTPDRLNVIHDGLYMFGSTAHWQPILNGYNGYYPRSYFALLDIYPAFPDERSIEYLKTRGVDLIIVHGGYMTPDRFGAISSGLVARPDIETVAKFEGPSGSDMVFRLKR